MNLDNYIESYLAPYFYDNNANYTLNYTNIKQDIYTIINDIYTSLITLFQPYYITLCDTIHDILSSTYITDLTHLTQNLPKINSELLYTSKYQHRIFLLFASFIVLSSFVLLPVRYHIYSTQPSLRTATGNTITTTTANVHRTVTPHNSNPSLLNKLLMSRTAAAARMHKTTPATPDLFDDGHNADTITTAASKGTARLTSPSATTTTAAVGKQEASVGKTAGVMKDTDRVMSEGQQQQQGLVSLYSRLTSVLLLLAKRNTSQPISPTTSTTPTSTTTTVSVKKECDKDKKEGAGSTDKSTSYTTTTTNTARSNTTVKSSSFTTVVTSYLPLSNGLSYVDFIHRLKRQASAGGTYMKTKETNALVSYDTSSSSGAAKG